MVAAPKKNQKVDLERIASQLASVRLLPVAGEDHHVLRAKATFTTRSFSAGTYTVYIGLRQAILHLEHPGYEIGHAYQAKLSKEEWSASWISSNSSQAGGTFELGLGAKILDKISFRATGKVGKSRNELAESKADAPYPIITAAPNGWKIGTELGDPRDPQGTLPKGLDHCLNGEYLSGRNGEVGDGIKEKNGNFALCELVVIDGANDPHISATLFGSSESLRIAVERSGSSTETPQTLGTRGEHKAHEDTLRQAFIEICIQRAKAAAQSGARTEAMVSGDIYLSHHEVHGPRTPSRASEALK